MALKDIFTMVKADKYTADGREELIKAQEEMTDAAAPDGTVRHRASGDHVKQGDKWVPVKNTKGKTPAKNPSWGEEVIEKTKAEQSSLASIPTEKLKKMEEVFAKHNSPTLGKVREELESRRDKADAESKPTEKPKAPKPTVQEYMKAKDRVKKYEEQYKKEMDDYEYMERVKGNGVDTSIFNPMYGGKPKPLTENKSYMEELGKIKAFEAKDSAPRVLTGDTKIRIKK